MRGEREQGAAGSSYPRRRGHDAGEHRRTRRQRGHGACDFTVASGGRRRRREDDRGGPTARFLIFCPLSFFI